MLFGKHALPRLNQRRIVRVTPNLLVLLPLQQTVSCSSSKALKIERQIILPLLHSPRRKRSEKRVCGSFADDPPPIIDRSTPEFVTAPACTNCMRHDHKIATGLRLISLRNSKRREARLAMSGHIDSGHHQWAGSRENCRASLLSTFRVQGKKGRSLLPESVNEIFSLCARSSPSTSEGRNTLGHRGVAPKLDGAG